LPFLKKEFPHLVKDYQQHYASRAFLPAAYRKRISSLMAALRKRHGFASREGRMEERPHRQYSAPDQIEQLALF
jgi:hypothetical protein